VLIAIPRGCKLHGVGKMLRFSTENLRLARKWYKIGPWLLWNINRKSYVVDQYVSFPTTLSDPNPGFKVTVYLQGKYGQSYYRTLIGNHAQCIKWYHIQ